MVKLMAAKRRNKKQKYRLKEEAKRFLVYFGVSALILLYAIVKCNDLIEQYGLEMKIIDASYTFDREQLIFRFVSDSRVDFRQLR